MLTPSLDDTIYAYVDRDNPSKYVIDIAGYLESKNGNIIYSDEASH